MIKSLGVKLWENGNNTTDLEYIRDNLPVTLIFLRKIDFDFNRYFSILPQVSQEFTIIPLDNSLFQIHLHKQNILESVAINCSWIACRDTNCSKEIYEKQFD